MYSGFKVIDTYTICNDFSSLSVTCLFIIQCYSQNKVYNFDEIQVTNFSTFLYHGFGVTLLMIYFLSSLCSYIAEAERMGVSRG